ncbi:hypothetical protein ACSCBZ_46725 [Streptomyces niveiscabiei]|nr:hypothetical protein [Streptomyces niveiscabiei]
MHHDQDHAEHQALAVATAYVAPRIARHLTARHAVHRLRRELREA